MTNTQQEEEQPKVVWDPVPKPYNDGRIRLSNSHLASLPDNKDTLYHLGLNTQDDNLPAMFGDVKFVCMGGAVNRMKKFAELVAQKLNYPITPENPLVDLTAAANRFAMYKVGPVLSISHGMGVGSFSILLHEIFKLVHYANCRDVTFFRIGTCGGIGVEPGTVVITENAVDTLLRECYELHISGVIHRRQTTANRDLINELEQLANSENTGHKTVLGKTMCANDFYEAQCRLDGAICLIDQTERANHIRKMQQLGVKNIEMEATVFASMCLYAGVPGAIVCVTLLDRLDGDQVRVSSDLYAQYQERPQELVVKFIQKRLNEQ